MCTDITKTSHGAAPEPEYTFHFALLFVLNSHIISLTNVNTVLPLLRKFIGPWKNSMGGLSEIGARHYLGHADLSCLNYYYKNSV